MITQSNTSRASSISRRMRSDVRAPIGSDVGRPAGRSVSRSEIRCSGSFGSSLDHEAVGQARLAGHLKDLVQRRPPQVAVDQQHVAAVRLAQRQRQVRRGERLPFASHRARDHDDLESVRALRLVQGGRQPAVLLARSGQHRLVDDGLRGQRSVHLSRSPNSDAAFSTTGSEYAPGNPRAKPAAVALASREDRS